MVPVGDACKFPVYGKVLVVRMVFVAIELVGLETGRKQVRYAVFQNELVFPRAYSNAAFTPAQQVARNKLRNLMLVARNKLRVARKYKYKYKYGVRFQTAITQPFLTGSMPSNISFFSG